jgi:hypothetical protein
MEVRGVKMTRKANGEGSVFRTKNGYWKGAIMIGLNENGKPLKKTFSSKTEREVRKKMREYKEAQYYEDKSRTNYNESKLLCSDLLTKWTYEIKQTTLKKQSFKTLESRVKNNIILAIGHYTIAELNSDIIQKEVIDNLYKTRKQSYATI